MDSKRQESLGVILEVFLLYSSIVNAEYIVEKICKQVNKQACFDQEKICVRHCVI